MFNPFSSSKNHADYVNDELVQKLLIMLPHGSGINYSWEIYQHKTNVLRFTAHNIYCAMNENGYYCHVYPFSVTLDYNPTTDKFEYTRFSFKGNREYVCCGFGIADYLKDEMFYSLEFRQDKE